MQRRTNGFVELLAEEIGEKTADKIKFKNMEMSTKSGEWTLFFSVVENISPSEKDAIKKSAAKLLPDNIAVNIVFEDLKTEKCIKTLIEHCISAYEAAEPILKRCKMHLEDDRMIVDTCGLPRCVLDSIHAVELLKDGCLKLFNKKISVEVTAPAAEDIPVYSEDDISVENKIEDEEIEHEQVGKVSKGSVLMGRKIGEKTPVSNMKDIKPNKQVVAVKGFLIKHEKKELKKGSKNLYILTL
ncbi:MAG TPA: hypothetical protein PLZ84_07980, partial [Clostridia bacterium]|nr:hypothetical protein [Clostridia bacterium]